METTPARQITLAVHTYHKALEVKQMLEKEGVTVTLQNINLSEPCTSAGVRLRIEESQLPLALRIVENPDVFAPAAAPAKTPAAAKRCIIVPVEYSALSLNACRVAFAIAAQQNATILLLHAYTTPYPVESIGLSDMLTFEQQEIADSEDRDIRRIATEGMKAFEKQLRDAIKKGELAAIPFTSRVVEGVPEEAILKTAKELQPILIVMATRGADVKERELVGSISAEVLDSSRYPVVTIPPTVTDPRMLLHPRELHFFVDFLQEDLLALDALHNLLPPNPDLKISFISLTEAHRHGNRLDAKSYHALLNYAERHYPECHFNLVTTTSHELIRELAAKPDGHNPDLIVVPNRKRNLFARLFNPGMAHRLLFHTDIPMAVFPV